MIRIASAALIVAGFVAFAGSPKTVVDLQEFRRTSSTRTATLINLNPAINAWFLLSLNGSSAAWHLENPRPREMKILLEEGYPAGLVIAEGSSRYSCDLFGSTPNALEQGRKSARIYYPLCEGRLYLRNPATGQRTTLETATEFLRDRVWGGERVIDLFHHLMGDRYRETAEDQHAGPAPVRSYATDRPVSALLDAAQANRLIAAFNLGIALQPAGQEKQMSPGAWYPAAGNPGVYVSVMQPNFAAPAILQSYKNLVSNLDSVDASSLCYLIAFDLSQFELGFSLGTTHPLVNWSNRVAAPMQDAGLPGPDGIGTVAPLTSTGMVSPENAWRTVATFTAGFKRSHGAFRYGDLALKNHGSHYGFIENGVVFSRLQPGLATVFTLSGGSVELKTWPEADNSLLPGIRYARQNGVPLIEAGAPGQLVARWGPGNWSGSEDQKLRTIRGGLALQSSHDKRFLIYAVFSSATPSAMVRVFRAYQCNYAMLTDMNALEHTYLALYRRSGSALAVDHLLKGMDVLDKSVSGQVVPRFLGFPDNRDFFYVMRRDEKEKKP